MGHNRNRDRGYRFEHDLTCRINTIPGWRAWRLGASEYNLPDILCVNNTQDMVVAIECKSTIAGYAKVRNHQLEVCYDVAAAFQKYKHHVIRAAFKFHQTKMEYHCEIPYARLVAIRGATGISCNIKGVIHYMHRPDVTIPAWNFEDLYHA